MRRFLQSLFFLNFMLLVQFSNATAYYWIGGTGNWSDASHWSLQDGGAGGAGVPGVNDDVFFTSGSFSSSKNVIRFDVSASIRNFNFSAQNSFPRFQSDGKINFTITGNWIVTGQFQNHINGNIRFNPSQPNAILQTGNVHFRANLIKQGYNSLSLQNNDLELEPGFDLVLESGAFFTSGKGVKADQILFSSNQQVVFNSSGSSLFTLEPIDPAGTLVNWIANGTEQFIIRNTDTENPQLRLTATCGTAPNQFTINAQVVTNYNGQHVSCKGANDGEVCVTITGAPGPFNIQWLGGGPATSCWTGLGAGTYTVRVINTGVLPNVICATTVTIVEPGDLTVLSWSTTDPSCNYTCDGTATPFVFGGTPGYTYTWSSGETAPVATQLCVGLNTMNVVDANGCTFDTTFFILTPLQISPNLITTNLACFGVCNGSVESQPTGGNGAPYSYSWSNGATTALNPNLCAGNYSVTVSDNAGCTVTASATVTQPQPIIVTLTNQTNLICNNVCSGSLTVNAAQGVGNYSYQWFTSPGNTPIAGQTSATASGLCAGSYYVVVTDDNGCSQTSAVFTITQPTPVTASTSFTPPLCHNECNATLSGIANGGTPGYVFTWINAATATPIGVGNPLNGVCPGTYFAQVQDGNGCLINTIPPMTIPNPPALALLVNPVNTVCHNDCNGSSSVVSASGGTGALTVSWLSGATVLGTGNSITGLCDGTYTARVTDANGCVYDTTFVIAEPAPYSFSLTTTPVSCVGTCNGTAVLSGISGETSPYSVSWSSSGNTGLTENNLCSGNFLVTIIDVNGCDTIHPFTITAPPVLSLNPSFTEPSCAGVCDGTATAGPAGGTLPYTIAWFEQPGNILNGQTSDPATGLCDGNYSVTVTDGLGCTATASYTLTDPITMVVASSSTTTSCGICDGTTTVNIIGGTAPYSVVWMNATTMTPTGQTGITATGVCAGNYFAIITDANGCSVNSPQVTVSPNVIITASAISVSPSCFGFCNGMVDVTVSGGTAPFTFQWFDQTTNLPIGQSTEDAIGLCAGTYYVTITDVNNCSPAPLVVTLTQPNQLTATANGINPTCFGVCNGTLSGTASGGTAPFSFSWVDVATGVIVSTLQNPNGICSGTYALTVTDALGCSAGPHNVTLVAPASIVVQLNSSNALCFNQCNGQATVTVAGGTAPYTATWSSSGNTALTETGLCDGNYTVTVTDANGCASTPQNFSISEPLLLSATTTNATVLCNGDCNASVSVAPVGGTAPYSYQWNAAAGNQTTPVANNLCAGSYSVIVTDANGCTTGPLNSFVTQPTALSGSATATPASCNGICNGTATVAPAGGTAPYTFSWSDPFSQNTITAISLCGGSYSVIITDANGCSFTPSAVTVTEPSVLTVTASGTNATCFDVCNGTATVSIVGGTAPFAIVWNDLAAQTSLTATGLCDGNYNVQVTDANGCSGNATATITEPTAITATSSSVQATCGVCNGSATVNPSGGTGILSILWSVNASAQTTPTASGLCAGIYDATITDANGCTEVITVGVSDNTNEILDVAATQVSCFGDCNGTVSVNVTCADPTCTLVWNDPAASTTNTVTGLCAGTYAVTVTNGLGCITIATVDVIEPPLLTLSMSNTDVLCFGTCTGTGTALPAGGTAPYSFAWNAAGQTTSTSFNLCPGTFSVVVTDASGCTVNGSVIIDEPSPLSATIASSDADCQGQCNGTGTVFPSGGISPYTFLWDDPASQTTQQATALCGGQYQPTVFDANGCTFIPPQITIQEPDQISLVLNASPLDCNGDCNGIATSSVTGGTAPYFYQWNDPLSQTTANASNLCAGNYELIVTDVNGCIGGPGTVAIATPVALNVSFSVSSPLCSGQCNGSVSATVIGGTQPYTYQWNNPSASTSATVSGLCAGFYTLIVTDANGCSTTASVAIDDPMQLILPLTFGNVSCFGSCNGFVTSNPIGGTAPYSYLWNTGATSPGVSGLCPGLYSVVVRDANGCVVSGSRNIIEPAQLSVTSTFSPSTCGVCNGIASVSPSGGTPAYSYQWNAAAGNQTTQAANGLCAGVYSVVVTDNNGCTEQLAVAISDLGAETVSTAVIDATCFGQCNGSATAITACVNGPCAFEWYSGITGVAIGQTNAIASGLCAGNYFVEVTNALNCVTIVPAVIGEPTEITANAVASQPSCNGDCNGSAIVNPSGGTGPYTILWDAAAGGGNSATVNNLCSGTYIVTITDATGCSDPDTVILINPTILQASAAAVDVACSGNCNGSALLTISGGNAPYLINWNDPFVQTSLNAVGLCAGSFIASVQDANGCVTQANAVISEPAALIVTMGISDNLCFGDCTGQATAIANGGTSPYTYIWNDALNQTSATATGLCPGNYQVIVTDANTCTVTTFPVAITNPTQVSISVTATDVACNGSCNGSITVTPSGGSGPYSFSINGGLTFQAGNTFNGLCAGSYEAVVMDANNCLSVIQNININQPTQLTATDQIFPADCNTPNGAATILPLGGTPLYTFVWMDQLLNPIGQTTQTAINLSAGVYVAEVTDANGCVAQVSVTVNNVISPTVTPVVTNVDCNSNCNGAIDITVTSGAAPFSFFWFPGGQISEDLTGLCAGGYLLQVTDAAGCIGFANLSVTQPAQLNASFIVTDANCGQCDGAASVTASGGTGSYVFDWSNGQTGSAASSLCAGAYMVMVTDNSGCSANFNVPVNNIGGPNGENVTVTNPVCNGDCNGTISLNPIGGTAPYSFYWIHDGATINTSNNLCAGTYYLEVTDANGCVRVSTIDLIEPASLNDSLLVLPSTCGNCDGTLSVFVFGGTPPLSYQWNAAAGNATTSLVSNLCAGIYEVEITDGNGCATSQFYTLNDLTAATLSLSAQNVSCQGNCDASSTALVSGGAGPFSTEWFLNDGTSTGQSGTTAVNLCAGDYIVEVTDAAGCIAFEDITITEPDSLLFALPFVQAPSCFNSCDGIAVAIVIEGSLPYVFSWNDPASQSTATASGLCTGTFIATVTDANGCSTNQTIVVPAPAAIVLSLDSTDASCSTVADGAINATVSGGAGNFTFNWTGPNGFTEATEDIANVFSGIYYLTVTDANGCSLTDSIIVNAILVVNAFAGNDTTICAGSLLGVSLTGSGGVTYEWFDMIGVSLGTSQTVNVNPQFGTSDYILVANNNGCIDSDTVSVSVNTLPSVSAGPDIDIVANTSTVIGGSPTTSAGNSVLWVPSYHLSDSLALNPVASPDSSTNYIVFVTDANGCVNSDTMRVQVFPFISFPNGFSPNGDGMNEVWQIDFIRLFPEAQVEIYNRWGQLLFLSIGYNTPWDGTFNNQPVPVGTYYYIINLNHPLYPDAFTGPLTVIR
ncbi:MAG TPA: gliding motility-associated C-terminal domain-containing protein [Flavobacteriales bacterium]|nr:gliding motility-associated C-terminal domain-containing protein [Flavobacteriales bacterium]HRJ34389.1 gliding motility-associated C-terminal domain-containing protein [Flavobacteriales bacterium]HRJ37329.1 gliding motility-associated C-terminal domain-containing protein [Flavobacteriales bacterium]